ncbi:MAG: c-type cytochrome [Magnetococcales bacterium]|nr:c-type cytochrome [Magnetococcales bacterium]
MNNSVDISLFFLFFLAIASVHAVEKHDEGEILYHRHSCNQCHGVEGKMPKSDMIPKIGGRDAEFIKRESVAIIGGSRKTSAMTMHDKTQSEAIMSCDVGPSDEELGQIAAWLSGR